MSPHAVIAGGGMAALEGMLALQARAGARVRISVVCPSAYVPYRALSVSEPFGGGPVPRLAWARIARERGVAWIPDAVTAIRPAARELVSRDGPPLRYDAVMLALGARPVTAVPGALPFAGPRDVLALREAIEALAPGRRHVLAFVAAAGVGWTLPLYELALLAAAHGRRHGLDLAVELVTAERDPLGVFGGAASAAVARRLAAAGIRLRTGARARAWADGRLELDGQPPMAADLAIALPRLAGPALPGLPADGQGFVPVDGHGRVRGLEGVWAAGDMTARRLKQGGLAAQQADVAAADIAAAVAGVGTRPRPYRPTLRGMLLTGAAPLYLERRPGAPARSAASEAFLWAPPEKVAGRHIGAYLAGSTRS